MELNRRKEFCKARDIAEEIDMESRRIEVADRSSLWRNTSLEKMESVTHLE